MVAVSTVYQCGECLEVHYSAKIAASCCEKNNSPKENLITIEGVIWRECTISSCAMIEITGFATLKINDDILPSFKIDYVSGDEEIRYYGHDLAGCCRKHPKIGLTEHALADVVCEIPIPTTKLIRELITQGNIEYEN